MEIKRILIAAAALILTCGCNGGKEEEDTRWKGMDAETRQKYFVNIFAYNMMSTYYLWNEEIKPQLGNWSVTEDPVAKVKALRYKDEMGREVDRWTQVTDDFESFQGKVEDTDLLCQKASHGNQQDRGGMPHTQFKQCYPIHHSTTLLRFRSI